MSFCPRMNMFSSATLEGDQVHVKACAFTYRA